MSSSLPDRPLSRRAAITGALGIAGAAWLAGSPSTAAEAAGHKIAPKDLAAQYAARRPTVMQAATAPSTLPSFRADFPTVRFSRYLLQYPTGVQDGVDYGLVRDPAGSARQVAFFDNTRGLRHQATLPRAAAETPRFIRPLGPGVSSDEYWFGASIYLPTPPPEVGAGDWFSIATPAFGPPFNGTSPLSLGVRPSRADRVQVLMGPDLSILGSSFYMPTNTWVRVAINFKFAYNGWASMWVGTGLTSTSWQQVPLRGASRASLPTMGRGVNDACVDPNAQANSSRIGAYGWPSRIFVGHHAVERSLAALQAAMR